MASIKKIEGKTGTSFKITVTRGRDSNGKQIRHFKTWTPDHPMTARQMEKEAQRVAFEFERDIELGFQADNRQTFNEYAKYVIEVKKIAGISGRTADSYQWILDKLSNEIGYMKLSEIRPQHLNALYKKLSEPGAKKTDAIAYPKVDFNQFVKDAGGVRKLGRAININRHTITALCRGEPLFEKSARKVASAMGKCVDEVFTLNPQIKNLSNTSIIRIHSFISVVLAQAEKEMLIPYNPAAKATPPPKSQYDALYFQPEQVQEILSAADQEPIRTKIIIYILAATGMRRSELMGLDWSKIDFINNQIIIDRCVTYTPSLGTQIGPTKTKNTRYVTIPQEIVTLLRQYKAWWSEQKLMRGDLWANTNMLFPKEDGGLQAPQMVNATLNAFSRHHNLPHINPHAFRHTAASIMIASGVDVVTVSKMLGHANPSMTTDTYSHIIEDAKRKATECVADVILRKKKA